MMYCPVEKGGGGAIDDFRLTIDYCISTQRTQRAESIELRAKGKGRRAWGIR